MQPDLAVRLILFLPLAGAVLNGLGGLFIVGYRQRESIIGWLACACVAVPFLVALSLFAGFQGEAINVHLFQWIVAGDLSVSFSFRIDELSLLMTLIVTGVGTLIHVYATGYMHGDEGFWRFFAYLNLFIFAMLALVLGNNLVVLFLGWEGVGLCSYLLIGYWYTDLKNSEAANKAFIVNRIGDFAFLIAMFILFRELGTLSFSGIFANVDSLSQSTTDWVVVLLFLAATGKSAQLPLFVWLPDAMAGPTPVSALIHAATMVTSGLYLLARMSVLVLASPVAMAIVAVVGALTAIVAATIALTQNDIKKVLAYSTVSQLGFMFMASGVGAFFVAIFHVLTHAFFKACLFLGSGSVIHAMHHVEHEVEHAGEGHIDPQDMRTMGGLARYMPSTAKTYLISTLAIAGIFPLSGFFSKDEILFKAFEYGYSGEGYAWFVWVVGLIAAVLTALYMTRSYILTFKGSGRWPLADRIHPRESPASMTVPLWILAGLATVGGFIGLPAAIAHGDLNWIHHWLGEPYGGPVAEPRAHEHPAGFVTIEWALLGLGFLIGVVGVWFGWTRYSWYGLEYDDMLARRFGRLYRLWRGKYYLDELYDRVVVKPLLGLSYRILGPFDKHVVDGSVNGVGAAMRGTGWLLRYLQDGRVQHYASALLLGVVIVIGLILFA